MSSAARRGLGLLHRRLTRLSAAVSLLPLRATLLAQSASERLRDAAAGRSRQPAGGRVGGARRWARRGFWVVSGAAALVATAAASAAANHDGTITFDPSKPHLNDPTKNCPLPAGMEEYCRSPEELLPMWRWTRVSYIWSNWSGGNFIERPVKAALGAMYDLSVRIMFIVASLVWDVLSRLLYMALQADLAGHLADAINATYHQVALALWNSGAIWLVLLIGYGAAIVKLWRHGIKESAKTVAWSVLSISMLLVMLFALGSDNEPLEPALSAGAPKDSVTDPFGDTGFAERGKDRQDDETLTPRWFYERTKDVSDMASIMLTDVALGLSKNNVAHGSYCSVYTHQLERLYLLAAHHKATDGKLTAKHYSPIFLSRLWERAYLGPWSQAQYGAPQNAYNGSCLWAETNSVGAPEIMAVWTVSCDAVGSGSNYGPDGSSDYLARANADAAVLDLGTTDETPLYGCLGTVPAGGEALPMPHAYTGIAPNTPYMLEEQDRAWRVFHPNGDDETLTFLNLASGCGLVPTDSLTTYEEDGGDPDGAPEYAPPTKFTDEGKPRLHSDGTLFVVGEYAYVQQRRIGMRPDKGEKKGHWFSADACRIWITGGKAASSLDNGYSDTAADNTRRGFYDTVGKGSLDDDHLDGEHQGLNSQYLQDRAKIGCTDAEVSAEKVSENMGAKYKDDGGVEHDLDWRDATSPEQAFAAASDICTFAGGRIVDRYLYGLIVLGTAFSFAFSLLGLTLGTVLAQILMAMVFMFLPVVLLLSAVPSRATRALLPRVVKLAFFAAMANAVFLLALTSLVLVIDILTNAVVASTEPGSLIRVFFLAVAPIVAKKILGKASKKLGLDITSIKGSLRTTSGLAAASLGSDRSSLADKSGQYGKTMMQKAYYATSVKDRLTGRGAQGIPRGAGSSGGGIAGSGGDGTETRRSQASRKHRRRARDGTTGPKHDTSSGSTGPKPTTSSGSTGPKHDTSSGSTGPKPTTSSGSTGPKPTTSSGSTGPKPTTSSGSTGPKPTTSSGSTGPRPTIGSTGPRPTIGSTGPEPTTGSTGPKPTTGSTGPKPTTGSGPAEAAGTAERGASTMPADAPETDAPDVDSPSEPDAIQACPECGEPANILGRGGDEEPIWYCPSCHANSESGPGIDETTGDTRKQQEYGWAARKLRKVKVVGKPLHWASRHKALLLAGATVASFGMVGLPAAAALWGGSRLVRVATRGPRNLIRNNAKKAAENVKRSYQDNRTAASEYLEELGEAKDKVWNSTARKKVTAGGGKVLRKARDTAGSVPAVRYLSQGTKDTAHAFKHKARNARQIMGIAKEIRRDDTEDKRERRQDRRDEISDKLHNWRDEQGAHLRHRITGEPMPPRALTARPTRPDSIESEGDQPAWEEIYGPDNQPLANVNVGAEPPPGTAEPSLRPPVDTSDLAIPGQGEPPPAQVLYNPRGEVVAGSPPRPEQQRQRQRAKPPARKKIHIPGQDTQNRRGRRFDVVRRGGRLEQAPYDLSKSPAPSRRQNDPGPLLWTPDQRQRGGPPAAGAGPRR